MKAGITGLPYSGKTTLYCSLTGNDYNSLPNKEIHIDIVEVPDYRLNKLYEIFKPKKKVHASIEIFDIVGRALDKSKGMVDHVLHTLKNAHAIIVVLDSFNEGSDPRKDFKTIMEDFAFNDLIVLTGRIERIEKELINHKSDKSLQEKNLLEECRDLLENGGMLIDKDFSKEEEKIIIGFQFLTLKPLIIVINISEEALTSGTADDFEKQFENIKNSKCASICAEVEMEIALLDEEDRVEYLQSMDIREPAIDRLIRLCYKSLGLISFFTTRSEELHAWTVRKGATALECAGTIHSDFERGFIRAETIAFDDFIASGSYKAAKEKGLLRIEGKDYVVKDGDMLTIRFNV